MRASTKLELNPNRKRTKLLKALEKGKQELAHRSNNVITDLNASEDVNLNQKRLQKIRMIQLLLVSLIRAVKKNDFTMLGPDIEH